MSCSEGLADIEGCVGEKTVPSVNTHVLPKVHETLLAVTVPHVVCLLACGTTK